MTSRGVLLIAKDICKSFEDLQVLKSVSMEISEKDVKVIIGPSGTGKSTFLRCINGLVIPDSGELWFNGEKVRWERKQLVKLRQRIGMVFQHFNLFMHLTVLDNVRLGLREVKRMSRERATQRAREALEQVGVLDKANAYPAQLSGGQQQRVAIARALAMDPILMLFDEPTSALDPELIGEVLTTISTLAQEGMTMLLVTHEMGFARAISNEIIFMENGTIVEQGPPEQFFTSPRHERTRQFLHKLAELYGGGGVS